MSGEHERPHLYVSHGEFSAFVEQITGSHAELAAKVELLPAQVVAKVEEKRREDRIRFWRNFFGALVGVATIVGATAGVILLFR